MSPEVYRAVGWLAHRILEVPPPVLLALVVIHICVSLWSHWTIVRRAGYPGCWSLMLLVPCLNVVFLLGFAFIRWPVQGNKKT